MPNINLKEETEKVINFIRNTLNNQGFKKVVLGLSGGIDSTASLYLLKKAIPKGNIITSHLHYFEPENLDSIIKNLPKENTHYISIKEIVDKITESLKISHNKNNIELGNIMARVRMIILYDLAKKYKGLVCGTENKSEHYLGYFTRFGDQASDFEPIRHLYKTQIYQLASHLGVPENIIEKKPSAGLWQNQTDENDFGFSYKEADQVIYLYFEQNKSINEIKKEGFKNTEKIINYALKNSFKHKTPYSLG